MLYFIVPGERGITDFSIFDLEKEEQIFGLGPRGSTSRVWHGVPALLSRLLGNHSWIFMIYTSLLGW